MPFNDDQWRFTDVVTCDQQVNLAGRVIHYGFRHVAVLDNITAHAGGGQASATPLGPGISIVTTVATANDSVVLTTPIVGGLLQEIHNLGANALNVYPASGHSIINAARTNLGANNPFSLAAGGTLKLVSRNGTTWMQR